MDKLNYFCALWLSAFSLAVLIYAQDQSGFISIDCGAPDTSNYNDKKTGLKYTSDADFIDSGVSKSISSVFRISTLEQQFYNVRSFPEGDKNCYTLNPAQGKGNKYLIRASFMYGNYDGDVINESLEFDLYLGANIWDSVKLDNASHIVTKEIIYTPYSDLIYVCLINKGLGTPFISVLELRGLKNNTYEPPNRALLFSRRWDMGPSSAANLSTRYKDDIYDRIWKSRNFDYCTELNTSLTIDDDKESRFIPASIVMRTAAVPINASENLTVTLQQADTVKYYYVYFHFAEVQELEVNQTREFNIAQNGVKLYGPFSPRYLKTDTFILKSENEESIQFSFYRTTRSTLPPLLNALEVYVVDEFLEWETQQEDADAMSNIKSTYEVKKSWQGDPCAPAAYTWDGLNCSYNGSYPPRILSLNLSSSGLTGQIAPYFSNLSVIQSLDLSNNSLTGTIPSFLSDLQFLRVLNLEQNQFTGSLPVELMERSKNGSLSLRVGENPNLCIVASCQKKNKFVIPLIGSVAALILILILIGVALYWRFIRRKQTVAIEDTRSGLKNGPLNSPNWFYTYADAVKITNNFEKILGKGGFGAVYHGYLDNTQVAVKVLSTSSIQGYKELQSEVGLLIRVHHKNLTALIGYFKEGTHMGLIYEYMAYGDLERYLSGKTAYVLSWEDRLRIATDSAQGLEYLHYGCKPPIVHRDVKSTNILLNDKLEAKLADFGLSRIFSTDSRTHVTTVVAGTLGYLDPEYYVSSWLNEKSDVYSFGVVLLEIITSRPVIVENNHISDWVSGMLEKGDINNIVDQSLKGDFSTGSAWKVAELALACVLHVSSGRPTMSKVVVELKECLAEEMDRKNGRKN